METMKVTVVKPFFLGGKNIKPGTAEVPADKVARLVKLGKIVAPDGEASAVSVADDRMESALARISGSLSVERQSGESVADFIERVADQVDATGGGELGGGAATGSKEVSTKKPSSKKR